MRKNEYFDKLWEDGLAFEAEKKAWEKVKEDLTEKLGYDHEAVKAVRENPPQFPMAGGVIKAVRAWKYKDCKENVLELNDSLWANEVEDFVKAVRAAGLKTFVVTDHSTGLMENIHLFAKYGCKLRGPKVLHEIDRWNDGEEKERMGLMFFVAPVASEEDKGTVEPEEPGETPKEEKKTSRRRNKKDKEDAA